MTEQRDPYLGARLEELDVREHGTEYWSAVMAAAEPELERLRAAHEAAGGAAETASPRPPVAAVVERHPTFGGGFTWWATAAVAAAVALFLLLGGWPGSDRVAPIIGPAPATAGEAIGYALGALDRYPGIEGTITSESVDAEPDEYWHETMDFVAAQDGSLRIESRDTDAQIAPKAVTRTLAYDASARTQQALTDYSEIQPLPSVDADGGSYYPRWWLEQSGLAAGEPDRQLQAFPLWRLRAYLRSMLSDPRARFIATEQGGRMVWVLKAEAVELASAGDRMVPVSLPIAITIDASTRLPLSMERDGILGGVNGELTRFDIRPLTESPGREEFTMERPDESGTLIEDGSENASSSYGGDQGFRDLPLEDAAATRAATAGMAAFPQWLPRGFALSSGTFLDEDTGVEYRPKPGARDRWVPRIIVSQTFRRGYDQAFVSMRVDPRLYSSSGRGTGKDKVRVDTSDPFVTTIQPEEAALWAAHTDDVRLTGGWFAGSTAHVVLEPETWPHLWVKKGPYVACVAGDLTAKQMVRIAESLEPWGAASAQ